MRNRDFSDLRQTDKKTPKSKRKINLAYITETALDTEETKT